MQMGTPTEIPGLYRDGESWRIRVILKKPGLTTERRKKIEGTKTDALEALAALRREVEEEVARKQRGESTATTTVGAYAPQWLKSLATRRKGKVKPIFFETRIRHLERFILPFFGEKEPRSIKAADIERWKDWLAEQRQPATFKAAARMRSAKDGRRTNPKAGQAYAHETQLTAWGTLRVLLRWVSMMADVPNQCSGSCSTSKAPRASRRRRSPRQSWDDCSRRRR